MGRLQWLSLTFDSYIAFEMGIRLNIGSAEHAFYNSHDAA